MNLAVGKRIKFIEEKVSYKIIACNDRYAICTKPFNARKTWLYTIVDLVGKRRGPDNMIFGPLYDYNDPVEAAKAIRDLMHEPGTLCRVLDISHRHDCKLNIEWVK